MPTTAKMICEKIDIAENHGVDGAPLRWKITPEGVHVKGEARERRTRGEPVTARKAWLQYQEVITFAANSVRFSGVMRTRTLLALLIAESRGNAEAWREEAHLQDASYGLSQMLTRTAHSMAKTSPNVLVVQEALPRASLPDDPSEANVKAWKHYLYDPRRSLTLAALYLRYQNDNQLLLGDPVALYAAYNAGGFYTRSKNATGWGFVTYGTAERPDQAIENFVAWFGDACAVVP